MTLGCGDDHELVVAGVVGGQGEVALLAAVDELGRRAPLQTDPAQQVVVLTYPQDLPGYEQVGSVDGPIYTQYGRVPSSTSRVTVGSRMSSALPTRDDSKRPISRR